MGHRLSKITTRTGDAGTTGLADGTRVGKDSPRMQVIGTIDELNSFVGLILTEAISEEVRTSLIAIQHDLFDLGGGFSMPGHEGISDRQLARLDAQVEAFNAGLSRLKEFILPGGSRAASLGHVARCVCRRAERLVACLIDVEVVPRLAIPYLNRLSDLLFVLSRVLNKEVCQPDVLWQPGLNRQ